MQTNHFVLELVERFIKALNDEKFDEARECLADAFLFEGVLGKRDGADVYIQEMRTMRLKYQLLQSFSNETAVCLWYEINMGGKVITASGWYQTSGNTITSLKVLFDPRPLLG